MRGLLSNSGHIIKMLPYPCNNSGFSLLYCEISPQSLCTSWCFCMLLSFSTLSFVGAASTAPCQYTLCIQNCLQILLVCFIYFIVVSLFELLLMHLISYIKLWSMQLVVSLKWKQPGFLSTYECLLTTQKNEFHYIIHAYMWFDHIHMSLLLIPQHLKYLDTV